MTESIGTAEPRRELPPHQEPLSDQVMGNLLSAVGNHEAKAIVLLIMRKGIIYSSSDLRTEYMSAQGQHPGWKRKGAQIFNYCEQSLAPIGLVAREVLDSYLNTYGYIRTDLGEDEGIPLAGLLLDFSRRYPHYSLIDLFASTPGVKSTDKSSEVKRAPITRLKIYRALIDAKLPIRSADLVQKVGENPNTVGHHLWQLADADIINYSSILSHEPFTTHKLSPNFNQGRIQRDYRHPQYAIRENLVNIFISHSGEDLTIDQIYNEYTESHMSDQEGDLPIAVLRYRINDALDNMVSEGMIEVGKFHKYVQSEITLSEEQKELLTDLVTLLEGFRNQDPDFIRRGRGFALDISSNPEQVSKLLAKAREHSPAANRRPVQESAEELLFVIRMNNNSTLSELRTLFNQYHHRRLTRGAVQSIMDYLMGRGRITFTKEKEIRKFQAVD